MKVVLDTNVFISGIFWKGAPNRIIQLAEKGRLEITATPEILEELFGVLRRKKFEPLFKETQSVPREIFETILELVSVSFSRVAVNIIKEDSADNKFLACALVSGAHFIISGDQHLLKLKKWQNTNILTPHEFLKYFRK